MTPLEIKLEILKAMFQNPPFIPDKAKEKIIENRKFNMANVDDAIQVEPIIIVKMVNCLYKELIKP